MKSHHKHHICHENTSQCNTYVMKSHHKAQHLSWNPITRHNICHEITSQGTTSVIKSKTLTLDICHKVPAPKNQSHEIPAPPGAPYLCHGILALVNILCASHKLNYCQQFLPNKTGCPPVTSFSSIVGKCSFWDARVSLQPTCSLTPPPILVYILACTCFQSEMNLFF